VFFKILEIKFYNKKEIIKFLKRLTIKEVVFLDEISKVLNFSFEDYLKNEKPYLTKNQILELKEKGFNFGAHSKNHPRYSEIDLRNQLKETIESIEVIREMFSLEDSFFSFPFSDDGVTNDFFNIIKSKKITTFGSSGLKDENIASHFQRIQMEYNSLYSAETIIKAELILYIIKKTLGRHKIKRK
jgi:peptidoglycan/xylan/chitin deacetylase (PgdA/CDA1 family)